MIPILHSTLYCFAKILTERIAEIMSLKSMFCAAAKVDELSSPLKIYFK